MTVPVFVNERRLTAAPDETVGDLLRRADPAWLEPLAAGRLAITDGRGLPLDPVTPVSAGLIVRAVVTARRPG